MASEARRRQGLGIDFHPAWFLRLPDCTSLTSQLLGGVPAFADPAYPVADPACSPVRAISLLLSANHEASIDPNVYRGALTSCL
jgi:hypothetical protein